MQLSNKPISMEFIAGDICTPSHLTSRTPQPAYPVLSAPHLVFALAISTSFFSMEHVCVSRSLASPAEPSEPVSLHVPCLQFHAALPPRYPGWQETLQSTQHTGHELREINCEPKHWVS